MFKKLVPDALYGGFDLNQDVLASAETVTIPPGQVRTVHTGLSTQYPLALSFAPGARQLDMCTLLTTAITPEREIQVAILNRDTEPVTIHIEEFFLISCKLAEFEDLGG